MTRPRSEAELEPMRAIYRLLPALRERQWMADANCRGMDPELFFPERGDNEGVRAAKMVCAHCEVRAPCLDYALGARIQLGIWGGLSERQRRGLKRKRSA